MFSQLVESVPRHGIWNVTGTCRAFDNSARVLRTVYRVGGVGGKKVRVLVQVPITFAIWK